MSQEDTLSDNDNNPVQPPAPQSPVDTSPAPEHPVDGQQSEQPLSTEEFFKRETAAARKEAESLRKRAKEAERLLGLEKQRQLESTGEWQKLYEQTKADLEAKTLEIDAASEYKTAFQRVLDARIKRIPEMYRGLIPTDYDPMKLAAWLDANEDRLKAPRFPNLDAGAGGRSGDNTPKVPSPQANELAQKLKIDPMKLT